MKTTITQFLILFLLFMGGVPKIIAQNYILGVSSGSNNKSIYLIDATDGTILDSSFINLNSQSPGTLKDVLQVGEQLWITDQTGDKIFIYDIYGNYLSEIATGLDNIRGLELVNREVWVTNDGSANGATADAIMRYSLTGSFLGYYLSSNTSLFDLVDAGSGMVYVSGLTNQGIHKINYYGNSIGNLVGPDVFRNLQQINLTSSRDLLAAVFQNHASSGNAAGVYKISTADGSILNRWPATGMRGVIELANGDILYSNDSGMYKINTTNNTVSIVASGSFQYFAKANLPHLNTPTAEKLRFSLYPNPSTDFIELKSDWLMDSIRVWDIQGKLILSRSVQSHTFTLDVSCLSKGPFIIETLSQNKIQSLKFIKN